MRKKCIVKQPAGIGDILYCLHIAERIIEKYQCDIIWPVIPQYNFISNYIKRDHLVFVDESENFPYKDVYTSNYRHVINNDNYMYIPLNTADEKVAIESKFAKDFQFTDEVRTSELIMVSKYKIVGLDPNNWSKSLSFIRDKDKENRLYYDILKLQDDTEYVLVNSLYASPPDSRHIDNIKTSGKYNQVVEVSYISGYNPFDWCKVMEQASEIHTADTCYTFLLEALTLSTSDVNIYSRFRKPNGPTFIETEWLFKSDFKWIHN